MRSALRALGGVVLAAGLFGCGTPEQRSRVDDDPQPLARAQPQDVGMDAARLRRAVDALPPPAEHGLRSLLVMRRGRLVAEHYWNGHDAGTQQDLRSATKSITSLLVGITIERGALRGVEAPLRDILAQAYPDAAALGRDITIAHLLTMSSGQACDDRDPRSPGQEDRMYGERDWVAHFLALPAERAPGSAASYCTGGVVALGRVVAEATGQTVPALADKALFHPLGIVGARWASFDAGRQIDTGGHLMLRPRDLARIGLLMLQQGRWGGRTIVSSAWIERATAEQIRIDGDRPYGYLWWRRSFPFRGGRVDAFSAEGNGGQYLFVLPPLELVVVFTGGNYNSPKAGRPFRMMASDLLPAILD